MYNAEVDEEKQEVLLTSQPSAKLNIVVKKHFSVDEGRKAVVVRYTMELVTGAEPVKFAPWEKTNVAAGAFIFWPNGDSDIRRADDMDHPKKTTLKAKQDDFSGIFTFDHTKDKVHVNGTKIRANSTGTWMAAVQGDTVFVKVFRAVPADQVAPGEGDVAVFARPSFASMESQGAYTEIKEGKPSIYVVCWYARRLPKKATAAKGDEALMKFVSSVADLGCPEA